jgi:hypothetical protein
MNKNVLNKMYLGSKVELAEAKIELGTIEDIAYQLKYIGQTNDQYNKLDATVQKNIKPLNDAYKMMVLNKDYKKKAIAVLDRISSTLTKQAKDLGIDVTSLPAYKDLASCYSLADQVNDSINNSINAVSTLGK